MAEGNGQQDIRGWETQHFFAQKNEKRNITALLACMKNEFYVLKTTPYFSP